MLLASSAIDQSWTQAKEGQQIQFCRRVRLGSSWNKAKPICLHTVISPSC